MNPTNEEVRSAHDRPRTAERCRNPRHSLENRGSAQPRGSFRPLPLAFRAERRKVSLQHPVYEKCRIISRLIAVGEVVMTAFTFLLALLALPFMVGVSHAQPPDEGVFVEVPSTVPPAPEDLGSSIATTAWWSPRLSCGGTVLTAQTATGFTVAINNSCPSRSAGPRRGCIPPCLGGSSPSRRGFHGSPHPSYRHWADRSIAPPNPEASLYQRLHVGPYCYKVEAYNEVGSSK